MFSDMKVLYYFEECVILKKLMPFIDYRHELMTTNEQYALFLSIRIQILVAGYTGATAQWQTMVVRAGASAQAGHTLKDL